MKAPKFTCPEIARLELFLSKKVRRSDFEQVEKSMDEIRNINYDLRSYARHYKRRSKRSTWMIILLVISLLALGYYTKKLHEKSQDVCKGYYKIIPLPHHSGSLKGDTVSIVRGGEIGFHQIGNNKKR